MYKGFTVIYIYACTYIYKCYKLLTIPGRVLNIKCNRAI